MPLSFNESEPALQGLSTAEQAAVLVLYPHSHRCFSDCVRTPKSHQRKLVGGSDPIYLQARPELLNPTNGSCENNLQVAKGGSGSVNSAVGKGAVNSFKVQ